LPVGYSIIYLFIYVQCKPTKIPVFIELEYDP